MNENENTNNSAGTAPAREGEPRTGTVTYRPRLAFYHPNAKGTGCAMQMDLHPAHDDRSGCIMAKFGNQVGVSDLRGPNPVYARFDWENGICVKLDFDDLCKALQVFRGECESIADGKGLYHSSSRGTTRIVLRHVLEPVSGYSLEVYRSRPGTDDAMARIFLSPCEALGISEAIAGSLAVIGFGIPVVLPHDTSAYDAENRNVRNVRAA